MGHFKKWSTRPFCRGNLLWFLFFIMWPPNTLFPTSSLHLKKVSLFCIRTFCFKFFSPILKSLSNFHNMECYDPQVLLYTRIHLYSTSFIYCKVCSLHFHAFLCQCLQLSMSPHIQNITWKHLEWYIMSKPKWSLTCKENKEFKPNIFTPKNAKTNIMHKKT
jgi:hypothetical protein